MKKILILGDANSAHILKWATGLASAGYSVKVFSLTHHDSGILQKSGVEVHYASFSAKKKLLYPFAVSDLWKLIREFKPDIVHAHYASSYGFLGALAGFHPYVLSVWGSDVFDFPKISPLHKWILKFNLKKADRICSTSWIMKEETKKYTGKDISVIPFGIDLNVFKPFYAHHVFKENSIVIGTVKAMEKKYGVEYLIDAFALLNQRTKGYPLKLLIVGKGSLTAKLKAKVKDLGIERETVFTGYIPPAEVPFYQNMLTIPVFPSIDNSESFGVSVVEAMACEKPVVVTNVGGLPEVVEDGVSGLVVPPANAEKLADAIEKLVTDERLRNSLGKQGRQRVEKLYNWENNLASMIAVYEDLLAGKNK
jgi:glycosyltransferase involved in cell wall biosynthesis